MFLLVACFLFSYCAAARALPAGSYQRFFGGLLVLGLAVLRDFSIPGDEEMQRMTGEVSLLYVFQRLPASLQQRLLPARAAALIAQKDQSTVLQPSTP